MDGFLADLILEMNPKPKSLGLFILSFLLGCFLGVTTFFSVLGMFSFAVCSVLKGDITWAAGIIVQLFASFVAAVAGTYVCANVSGEARLLACWFLGTAGSFLFCMGGIILSLFACDIPAWFYFVRGLLGLLGTLIGYVLGRRNPFIDRLAARVLPHQIFKEPDT